MVAHTSSALLSRMAVFITCVVAVSMVVPPVASASQNGLKAGSTVLIPIEVSDDETITAQVPVDKADEYQRKLDDPVFREQELARATQGMMVAQTVSAIKKPDGTQIYTYGKREVLQTLNRIEHTSTWTKYLSSPMTQYLIKKACDRIDRSGVLTAIAQSIAVAVSDLASRQESWWKESAKLILRKKIHGVRMTFVPNNGGYPVMYRYLTRF